MSVLAYIILFTLLGSVGSLIGSMILLTQKNLTVKIAHFLASFTAGVLLGTAFVDLLPEAFEKQKESGSEINIFLWVLLGILAFFLLERFIHWFHHHHDVGQMQKEEKKSAVPLIILGDSFHNFIDGVIIAATFLVDINLGIVTTLAVAAHEIPQEIGDFGLLIHRGLSRARVILVNVVSALSALVGAILTYVIGEATESLLPVLLSLAAGFFIYIALSDLIPEIHNEDRKNVAFWETILLIFGVVVIWVVVSALE